MNFDFDGIVDDDKGSEAWGLSGSWVTTFTTRAAVFNASSAFTGSIRAIETIAATMLFAEASQMMLCWTTALEQQAVLSVSRIRGWRAIVVLVN